MAHSESRRVGGSYVGRGGSKPCRRAITAMVPPPQLSLCYCAALHWLFFSAPATQLSGHKNCPAPGPQTSSAYITPASASASAMSFIKNAFLSQMSPAVYYGGVLYKGLKRCFSARSGVLTEANNLTRRNVGHFGG